MESNNKIIIPHIMIDILRLKYNINFQKNDGMQVAPQKMEYSTLDGFV